MVAPSIQSYLTELVYNDGFCQISCGRCACCSAPTEVLKTMGAGRFLQVRYVLLCPALAGGRRGLRSSHDLPNLPTTH